MLEAFTKKIELSAIKEICLSHGVELFGILNTWDFSSVKGTFDIKKENGFNTSFEKYEFEKRSDMNSFFPGAKSILIAAFPYDTGAVVKNLSGISLYAARKDYHIVVKEKLLKIIADIKAVFHDNNFRAFVDSSLIFEKELAKMAGIGFYGENTLLYTEKYGSFVFLGGFVTDLHMSELKFEQKNNFCEGCGLCKRACPVGAIKGGGLIDSSSCLSYLTQINTATNKLSQVWGCDICQNICPLNRERTLSETKEFSLIEELLIPPKELLELEEEKLFEIISVTPIGKKKAGLFLENLKGVKLLPS